MLIRIFPVYVEFFDGDFRWIKWCGCVTLKEVWPVVLVEVGLSVWAVGDLKDTVVVELLGPRHGRGW